VADRKAITAGVGEELESIEFWFGLVHFGFEKFSLFPTFLPLIFNYFRVITII
jgi:hypothetical protein